MVQADLAKAIRDREEIKITVKGRRSGHEVTLPVWFVLEGKTLWLLPVHGSRTQWFRNVLADPTLTLRAGRRAVTAMGRPRRARSAVQRVLDRFRKKYSAKLVAQYYDHSDVVVDVPIDACGQAK
ncbi:MAG TPA: nitroreductase/quinone reductase family protein [bacterium]|nr:nitroreductase/quinone reductase family protein [bacterium]